MAAAQPEVVVAMPCGYDAARSHEEASAHAGRAAQRSAPQRVVAVDASAYFSRPGPRLVDGLELLAHILHPDLVPERRRRGRSRSTGSIARCAQLGRQPARR